MAITQIVLARFAMLELGARLQHWTPEYAALTPGGTRARSIGPRGPQTRLGTPQHGAPAAERGWRLLVVVEQGGVRQRVEAAPSGHGLHLLPMGLAVIGAPLY